MINVLIGIAALVLVVLLALIYRVFTLVQIAKKRETGEEPRVTSSNRINALLFIIFFAVLFGSIFWYSIAAKDDYMLPEAASEHGGAIDMLFWVTTGVVFFVFFVTHCLLFFFPYLYSYKEGKKAEFLVHDNRLELAWTVVPAIVLTILVVSGWTVWSEITDPAPEDSVEIEIVGRQFGWNTRYAGPDGKIGKHNFRKIDATNGLGLDFEADAANNDDFVANELVLPKGKNVLLKIRSRDVLHSVFLPHFRLKMDAVPGQPTQFWFKPIYTTEEMRQRLAEKGDPNAADFNYHLACTEICGSAHYAMSMKVRVLSEEEYAEWEKEQKPWAELNADYLAEKGIEISNMTSLK
ncbi:MAG: cytochrome c oxidase subunit II [Bernardetiaceae bacterium]|nr:cytochrome c oxidase subunit II [Bernardetiaceae bacterium]